MSTSEQFQHFVEYFILPSFPGSKVENKNWPGPKKNRHELATYTGNKNHLVLRASDSCSSGIKVSRSQFFEEDELRFIRNILKSASDKKIYDYDNPVFGELATTALSQAVATFLGIGDIAGSILSLLRQWACETYEGQNISMCIGVDTDSSGNSQGDNTLSLNDIRQEDFVRVLSNSHDSILVVNLQGKLLRLEHATGYDEKTLAPLRFVPIAHWANQGHVAFVLTRMNEILVFANGALAFSFRRGHWFYYTHEHNIQIMSNRQPNAYAKDARMALYLTALDMAFMKKGGCLGYLKNTSRQKLISNRNRILDKKYLLFSASEDSKTKTLSNLLKNQKFSNLPRIHRLELLAMDGAMIIDHNQEFVAVGALLGIKNDVTDSSYGGRNAAARTLGRLGLGIKISTDGYIRVFAPAKHAPHTHDILKI